MYGRPLPASINSIIHEHRHEYGSTLHRHEGAESERSEDESVYIDLGEDSETELTGAMESLVSKYITKSPYDNELSPLGVKTIRSMRDEYRSIFDCG